MKRILCAILTLCLLAALLPPSALAVWGYVPSGNCGPQEDEYDYSYSNLGSNATYTLTRDGVLTISGSGRICDFGIGGDGAPWSQTMLSQPNIGIQIEKLIINEGITEIGSNAFYGLDWLKEISLPDSLTRIGESAFEAAGSGSYRCVIRIPRNVSVIEGRALCCNIEYQVASDNPYFSAKDNILYSKDGKTLVAYPYCRIVELSEEGYSTTYGTETSFTIPDGVTAIGPHALELNCLQELTIPEGVREIGDYAIMPFLDKLSIPTSLTSIGECAFAGSQALTSVDLPHLIRAGERAFTDCSKLTEASVAAVGMSMFSNCTNLERVTLYPGNIETLPDNLFGGCNNLKEIIVPNGVRKISNSAFSGCTSLRKLVLPASVEQCYTSFGSYEFGGQGLTIYYGGSEDQFKSVFHSVADSITVVYNYVDTSKFPDAQEEVEIRTGGYSAVTEQRLFRVQALGWNHYPAPAGFQVYVGDPDAADTLRYESGWEKGAGTDDITVTIPRNYTGSITVRSTDKVKGVTGQDYYDYVIPAELAGQSNLVTMVPKSVRAPYPQSLFLNKSSGSYRSYRNLITEGAMVYEMAVSGDKPAEELQVCPIIVWGDETPGDVWLQQGESILMLLDQATSQDQANHQTWSWRTIMPATRFSASGGDVYLCARSAGGTVTRIRTELHMTPRLDNNLKLDIGDDVGFDPGAASGDAKDTVAVLDAWKNASGSGSIKIDLPKLLKESGLKLDFTIKDDWTLEGVIGVEVKSSDKRAAYGKMKETMSYLDQSATLKEKDAQRLLAKELGDLAKKGVKPFKSNTTVGVSGSASLMGYITGQVYVKDDGSIGVRITELKAAIVGSGSISYIHNGTFPGTPFPTNFQASLNATIEAYIRSVYNETTKQLEWYGADGQLQSARMEVSVALSLAYGPGWEGYATVDVKCNSTVKLRTSLPMKWENSSATWTGNVQLVGSWRGVEGSFTLLPWMGSHDGLLEGEKLFWDGSREGSAQWIWEDWHDPLEVNANAFTPDFTTRSMRVYADDPSVVTGVSGYSAPVLAKLPDGELLEVYVSDVNDTERGTLDKNGLWYRIYNGESWTKPACVYNDHTNDSVPQLYQENGTTYLAWQNYGTTYGTEPPMKDGAYDYEAIGKQVQVVVSTLMTDENGEWTWAQPEIGTPEWYLAPDTLPAREDAWPETGSRWLVRSGGGVQAVLYKAVDDREDSQIWGIFKDGNNWGEPLQLTNVTGGVFGFDAVMDGSGLKLLYTAGASYGNASLYLVEKPFDVDLELVDADYVPETLYQNNELALRLSVRNNSLSTVEGVKVSVGYSVDEDVEVRLDPGEEELLYVNYPLWYALSGLDVSVRPMMGNDTNTGNNEKTVVLRKNDLSLEEVTAVRTGDGKTQVTVQLVNRGLTDLTASASTLNFHKGRSDGDSIGSVEIPALAAGELANVSVSLNDLAAGDMLYVTASELTGGENLIGNNSSQATVLAVDEGWQEDIVVFASADRSGGKLTLSADVENRGAAEFKSLRLVAAAYDGATGRMLACAESESFDLPALNAVEQTFSLSLGSFSGTVDWKIFTLDADSTPQISCLSGTAVQISP